tara:strand:- start:994 stop:1638 length:645 start_codon:yes stop_codon:yes gene_type:complete
MLPKLQNFDKKELIEWLTYKAGSNNAQHFIGIETNNVYCQLELQQVPREYAELLMYLKNCGAKSYLNIGIGNGGSFIIESYIQPELELSIAVDNTSYGELSSLSRIVERIKWLRKNIKAKVIFYNMDSELFLRYNKRYNYMFDVIFIDGDHSYKGVKNDFEMAMPFLNKGGSVIFHDINSKVCEGVVKFWKEIKNKKCLEFIDGNKCGIGIYKK